MSIGARTTGQQASVRLRRIGTMGNRAVAGALSILIWLMIPVASLHAANPSWRVLILNSYHKEFRWTDDEVEGIKQGLAKQLDRVEFFAEYLDTKRVSHEGYLALQRDLLKMKYAFVPLSAVVVTDDDALDFIVAYQDELFPNVPVVFCGVGPAGVDRLKGRTHITGQIETIDIDATVDIALKLQPNASRIIVLTENSATGIANRQIAEQTLSRRQSLQLEFLDGRELTTEQLLDRLASIDPNSIVLAFNWYRDASGRYLDYREVYRRIADRSRAPIYATHDMWLECGALGGQILTGNSQGLSAATIAARILLEGLPPSAIPIRDRTVNPIVFSYPQMQRFGLPLDALPKGTVLIDQPPTFLDRYARLLRLGLPALAMIVLGSIVFAHILMRHRQMMRDHQLFQQLVNQSTDAVFIVDARTGRFVESNQQACRDLGYSDTELREMTLAQIDPTLHIETMTSLAGKGLSTHETQLHCSDGSAIPVEMHMRHMTHGHDQYILCTTHNLSQRRAVEDQLHQRQQMLQQVLDMVPYMIYAKDWDGHLLLANRALTGFYGLPTEQVLNQIHSAIHTDTEQIERITEIDRRVISTGKKFVSPEEIWVRSDGRERTLQTTRLPFEIGSESCVLTIAIDVTERKQVELLMRQSEDKYRHLFDMESDALLLIDDTTGAILEANVAAEVMYGYTRDDLMKLTNANLWADGKPFEQLGRPRNTRVPFALHRRKDGTTFPVEITCRLFRWRSHDVRVEAIRDIADRLQTQKTLEQQRMFLRNVIDALPISVAVKDDQGKVILANRATCDLYAAPMDVLIGKTVRELLKDTPAANRMYRDDLLVIEGERDRIEREEEYVDRSGKRRWLRTIKLPIRNNAGKIEQLLCVNVDITEAKTVSDELRRAKELAESATEAKSQFLANMSHEIRTPMNAVIGMIELLLDTELSGDQRDYAATARSSADSLLSLIDDILDFSKIEARKLRFQITEFSLHTIMSDVARMLEASTTKRGLRFISRIDDYVPDRLLGDPARLRQILVNLLANAVKFTHAGSVSMTVGVDQQDGSQIRLKFAVSDTGIGIPKDRMHHLFEYFSQIDSSSTRRYGGTGLGLAICSQLVEMMHGEIGVESELGKGSTFHFTAVFTIPVAVNDENEAEPAPAEPLLTEQQRHNTRILVVEDCTLNQRLILKFLSLQGYQTDLATNGEEAIHALAANAYDLVLMDIQMPTMDGIEASRIIRSPESDVRDHSVPIIALTAHATLEDQRLCLDAGMNDYITKPIKRSQLFAAIDTMLAKRLQLLPSLADESTPIDTRPDDNEPPILTVSTATTASADPS